MVEFHVAVGFFSYGLSHLRCCRLCLFEIVVLDVLAGDVQLSTMVNLIANEDTSAGTTIIVSPTTSSFSLASLPLPAIFDFL